MDSHRFDTLVAQLHRLRSRRQGLRLLLPALIAAVGLATPLPAAACKRKGEECRTNGGCCSGRCQEKKRDKKKNGGAKKEKPGTCDCSKTRERCKKNNDCCAGVDVCASNGCEPVDVCCTPAGGKCKEKCDCCGDNPCLNGLCGGSPLPPSVPPDDGTDDCGDLAETGEPCQTTDDCCFEEDICASNGCVAGNVCCATLGTECERNCECCSPLECGSLAAACEPAGEAQCCVPGGGPCTAGSTCQCCAPLQCDPDMQVCISRPCCPPGGSCNAHSGNRSVSGEGVSTNGDCQCCGGDICVNGTCGGSCSNLGEACDFDEDCCASQHNCANNTKSIGCPGPSRFCCGDIGAACTTDCDCCGEVLCFANGCGML